MFTVKIIRNKHATFRKNVVFE